MQNKTISYWSNWLNEEVRQNSCVSNLGGMWFFFSTSQGHERRISSMQSDLLSSYKHFIWRSKVRTLFLDQICRAKS